LQFPSMFDLKYQMRTSVLEASYSEKMCNA